MGQGNLEFMGVLEFILEFIYSFPSSDCAMRSAVLAVGIRNVARSASGHKLLFAESSICV
jgi:hypothetical protein